MQVAIKGSHNGTKIDRYHTDETCRHYPDNPRTISEDEAEERGMQECDFCSGDAGQGGSTDPWKYHNMVEAND